MSKRPKECLENDLYKEEEKVLEEFKKKIKNNSGAIFVKDGAICPKTFLNEKIKILFILKEVNGGEEDWDLRNFAYYNCKDRKYAWDNIYRWTRVVSESDSISWEKVSNVKKEHCREKTLRKISVMNMKKIPGGSSSKNKELTKATLEHKGDLQKQIELYDADYIILGNTYFLLEKLDYLTEEERKYKNKYYLTKKSKACKYFVKKLPHKKQIIINFYHPSAQRLKPEKLFDLFLEIIKDIKKLENIK